MNQNQRTKLRLIREAESYEMLTKDLDISLFNRFNWCRKVSRSKLIKLYQSDAQGLLDEELLDDIGYTFFARCKQAQDTRTCLKDRWIICHHCGTVLTTTNPTSVTYCTCGHCYSYREYRRSFNSNNMPAGRAKPIFDTFTDKWPICKDKKEKIILIDWLIHECHVSVMSGLAGRSVCVNLIEGSTTQLRDMLEMLAGH